MCAPFVSNGLHLLSFKPLADVTYSVRLTGKRTGGRSSGMVTPWDIPLGAPTSPFQALTAEPLDQPEPDHTGEPDQGDRDRDPVQVALGDG